MNTYSKNSFRQKMFKCAVMIIILLQAACAANVTMLGDGPNDWTAPNPSKLAANGSGASLTCRLNASGEVNEAPDNHIDAQTAGIIVVKNQDIQRVSIENDSSVRKGAVLGFLIGAGTGAIIGLAAGDDSPSNNSDCAFGAISFQLTAEGKAVIGGILGGVAGSIVGTVVGAAASE